MYNIKHIRNGKQLAYCWGVWHLVNLKDCITIETLDKKMPSTYTVQGWKSGFSLKETHALLTDEKDYRPGHEDEIYPWFPNGSHPGAWSLIAGGGYAIRDEQDGEIMVILPGDVIEQYIG